MKLFILFLSNVLTIQAAAGSSTELSIYVVLCSLEERASD